MDRLFFSMLRSARYVATTADCWSANKKSYLGVTAHWMDPVTRERHQAILACKRLLGRHTYSHLAAQLSSIHEDFELPLDKLVM